MRIALRPPVVLSFSTRTGRAVAFFVLAFIRAAVLSAFVLAAVVTPLQHPAWLKEPLIVLARVLDVPISLISRVLPFKSPASLLFPPEPGSTCFLDRRTTIYLHMRAGIASYLLLFYLPALCRLIRGRLRPAASPSHP